MQYLLYLINTFFSNDKNVVIICGRNIDTVIAIISSILSGKTFCPISDKTPKKRIRFILNKLKTEILINASSEKFDKDLSCINIKKKFKKIKKFNKKKIVNSKNKILGMKEKPNKYCATCSPLRSPA